VRAAWAIQSNQSGLRPDLGRTPSWAAGAVRFGQLMAFYHFHLRKARVKIKGVFKFQISISEWFQKFRTHHKINVKN
jgi:hypothetical protein